jgi:hypothetical protein
MGGFAHILAYKSPKTPFFALKYLTRYTHETFFEECISRRQQFVGVFASWEEMVTNDNNFSGSNRNTKPLPIILFGYFSNKSVCLF